MSLADTLRRTVSRSQKVIQSAAFVARLCALTAEIMRPRQSRRHEVRIASIGAADRLESRTLLSGIACLPVSESDITAESTDPESTAPRKPGASSEPDTAVSQQGSDTDAGATEEATEAVTPTEDTNDPSTAWPNPSDDFFSSIDDYSKQAGVSRPAVPPDFEQASLNEATDSGWIRQGSTTPDDSIVVDLVIDDVNDLLLDSEFEPAESSELKAAGGAPYFPGFVPDSHSTEPAAAFGPSSRQLGTDQGADELVPGQPASTDAVGQQPADSQTAHSADGRFTLRYPGTRDNLFPATRHFNVQSTIVDTVAEGGTTDASAGSTGTSRQPSMENGTHAAAWRALLFGQRPSGTFATQPPGRRIFSRADATLQSWANSPAPDAVVPTARTTPDLLQTLRHPSSIVRTIRTGVRELRVEGGPRDEPNPATSPHDSPATESNRGSLRFHIQPRAPPASESLTHSRVDIDAGIHRLQRLRFSIAPRGPSLTSASGVKSVMYTLRSLS